MGASKTPKLARKLSIKSKPQTGRPTAACLVFAFLALRPGGRPDSRRARDAEVVLEQGEVEGVDHGVPREVSAAVVPRLADALAEGAFEDAKVESVHVVAVVAVARPH